MAIITTDSFYICDICKQKITDYSTKMFTYILPVKKVKIVNDDFYQRESYDREFITPSHKKIDLCESCNNKLITALEKSYGVIKVFTEPYEIISFEPVEKLF